MTMHRSIMIKPASSACNLACDYCFYKDEAAHRQQACWKPMDIDVARALVSAAMADAQHVTFAFQGGEPTLVGLPWFEQFVQLVNEQAHTGCKVSYALQTNATLLDDAWGAFLHEHDFLVGVSFDGYPMLNNLHRQTTAGSKSSAMVKAGIQCLQHNQVQYNILSVVTDEMCSNFGAMWGSVLREGHTYLQFIPCLDPLQGEMNRFLSPQNYGKFLCDLFGAWERSYYHGPYIYIRFFENIIMQLAGVPAEECDMRGACSVQYVVESNGNVYPCDFYCLDSHVLGNVVDHTFAQLDQRREEIKFLDVPQLPAQCLECACVGVCHNGCPRNRDTAGVFRYCSSYRKLFAEYGSHMQAIAADVIQRRKSEGLTP